MEWWSAGFNLIKWFFTSFLKADFQEASLGFFPLKMRALRSFQMHQAATIRISMKKGFIKLCLDKKTFWCTLAFSSQVIPRANHRLTAEGQSKNKCSKVSSVPSWQRTQLYPCSRNFFLVLKIFLVLSLSSRRSQEKNFDFWDAFGLPNPDNHPMRLQFSEMMLIELAGGVFLYFPLYIMT